MLKSKAKKSSKKISSTTKKLQKKVDVKSDTYHHGDLKANLIKAALKMLKTKSPDELSLRELAREVGVSQAAPYRHFKDKDALLAEISKEGFDLKFKFMSEAIKEVEGNIQEIFYNCGLAYFRMGHKHPEHFNLMCRKGVTPDQTHPELMRAAASTYALLWGMIASCQKEGLIGPGDPLHISLNCWSVVHGFTSLYSEGRLEWIGVTKDTAEKALKTLMCQFLNGSKAPLDKCLFGFAPFQTEHSKFFLENLKQLLGKV